MLGWALRPTLHIAHSTKSWKTCDVLHIARRRKNRHFLDCGRSTGLGLKKKLFHRHQQTGVLLYHIIFISLYYSYYDTIIFHYDTIISLICLQMSRLLFSLFQKPKKDYYFTNGISVISLILIRINCRYDCSYHTIIFIIFTSNYYYYYLFRRHLSHLFLYVYIIAIIAIMTLLLALFIYQTIIAIIFFETYYFDYSVFTTLSPLLQL